MGIEKVYVMPCTFCGKTSLVAKCRNEGGHFFPKYTHRMLAKQFEERK